MTEQNDRDNGQDATGMSTALRLAVLTERVTGNEKAAAATAREQQRALELQAEDYARRLEELNHAHKKQRQDQATYLGKEAFEEVVKNWDSWRASIERRLTLIEGGLLMTKIIPWLIAATGLALAFWRR